MLLQLYRRYASDISFGYCGAADEGIDGILKLLHGKILRTNVNGSLTLSLSCACARAALAMM